MSKILVTGASGLLGSNLCLQWRGEHDVLGTYRSVPFALSGAKSAKLVLNDEKGINGIFEFFRPDAVVHCAALANVDACEGDPQSAKLINSEGTANIAKAAQNAGALMVYISTDSVFDGTKGAYGEDDEPNPLNVYARTKLEGENHVKEICNDFMIIRTALYGWNAQAKSSLSEWIISKLEKGEEVPAFENASFSPCLVNDMGDAIVESMAKNLRGIYHIGSHSPMTKFEFAIYIAEVFGFDSKLIKPVKIEDVHLKAVRPHNVSLDVSKIEKALGRRLPGIREGLIRMKKLKEDGFTAALKKSCREKILSTAA